MISFRTWRKALFDYVKINTFALPKAAETISKTKNNFFLLYKELFKNNKRTHSKNRECTEDMVGLRKIKTNGLKHV